MVEDPTPSEPTMGWPGWLLALIARVERFEFEHSRVEGADDCMGQVLDAVPADVRAMAKGYAQARRETAGG